MQRNPAFRESKRWDLAAAFCEMAQEFGTPARATPGGSYPSPGLPPTLKLSFHLNQTDLGRPWLHHSPSRCRSLAPAAAQKELGYSSRPARGGGGLGTHRRGSGVWPVPYRKPSSLSSLRRAVLLPGLPLTLRQTGRVTVLSWAKRELSKRSYWHENTGFRGWRAIPAALLEQTPYSSAFLS